MTELVSHHLTHLVITEVVPDDGRKTRVWRVDSKYGGIPLGKISWFSRWRKYGFYPDKDTVYEEVCMRELSDFIVERTKDHKAAKRL